MHLTVTKKEQKQVGKKVLTKKLKSVGMTKAKEQDLKKKGTRRNDACKSKGTRWK